MSNRDLISVIISAYNHEKYVQETINSIIAQTYKNIELLIIDDGSSDSTLQKIEEMRAVCENRFIRFDVQTQGNKGIIPTMNLLLELAQGEYVFTIASDDKAAPNALAELHNFLSEHEDYAIVVGENKFIDENSKPCYWDKNKNVIYNIEEALQSA